MKQFKDIREFKMPDPGLGKKDLDKIGKALSAGKSVIGQTSNKYGSNKGKPVTILKVKKGKVVGPTIYHGAKVWVKFGSTEKWFDASFVTSYSIDGFKHKVQNWDQNTKNKQAWPNLFKKVKKKLDDSSK